MLKPPSLLQFVEPEYPQAAFEEGLNAEVVVEILVGPDGRVQAAKVVQPVGHGFDEAAVAAAQQLVFQPATADGKPIPARIHFPFVFEIEEKEEEVDAAALPARFEGQVLSAEDGGPIVGAGVTIASVLPDGPSGQTATEADGRFYFMEVPAGGYRVTIEASGFDPLEATETLIAGQALEGTYRLELAQDDGAVGFGATARVPPPPREVTRRSIGTTQLTRIAGTRGDALRAVELMPGVARPPLGVGALIVRGSAPQDSLTMLEGLPVPLLYHFGGLTSFINSRLLERIDFYPGNFSVRYGRRRGGIVEVKTRNPNKERFAGILDFNLIDSSFLVEGPVTDGWQVAAAARRSQIDLVLDSVLTDDISVLAAPVYYDYQVLTTFQPSEQDELRLMVFGSSDRLELLFEDPMDALTAGSFDFQTQFHRAHFSYQRKDETIEHDVDLSVGYVDFTLGAGELTFRLDGMEIYGRAETRGRISDRVRLIGGLDVYAIPGHLTYNGPAVESNTQNPNAGAGGGGSPSTRDQIQADSDFFVLQPALYLESELDLRPLRLVLGTRLDYDDATRTFAVDPRMVAHWTVTEDFKLKGGVGLFSQPPDFPESNPDLGNPNLKQSRTTHLSLGSEWQVAESVFLGLDGFYKYLSRVVVGTELGDAPLFTNEGTGRIYGAELAARVEPKGSFFGYASYTLSRSERSVRGGPYRVFAFDQPHILTVSGTYRFGGGWELGGTFRLVSGNPNTPIIDASRDLATGDYVPVYGEINSVRDPAFHRLDVRLLKEWDFKAWKLAAYLDIQNVYNAENPQGRVYNYDFSESQPVRGLPIFPSFGLRGEI